VAAREGIGKGLLDIAIALTLDLSRACDSIANAAMPTTTALRGTPGGSGGMADESSPAGRAEPSDSGRICDSGRRDDVVGIGQGKYPNLSVRAIADLAVDAIQDW